MRGRTYRGAWVLLALMAIAPARLSAQSGAGGGGQYAPADPQVPLPYGSTRPEDGGFYTYAKLLLYRQSNPLRQQLVAVRGLFAYESGGQTVSRAIPSFSGVDALGNLFPLNPLTEVRDVTVNVPLPASGIGIQVIQGVAFDVTLDIFGNQERVLLGQFTQQLQVFELTGLFDGPGFVGSAEPALDVQQLRTRNPYQPGLELGIGWKFRDGSSVSLGWKYLTEVQQRAGATLAPTARFGNPPSIDIGDSLTNTFLFSPVFNFPPEYAGADFKVNVIVGQTPTTNPLFPFAGNIQINPQSVYGIWNGASIMTLQFRQWFQQWEIAYREPVWETETYRVNGIVGPRYTWFWEKFKWTTTSIGQNPDGTVDNGQAGFNLDGPQNVGIYSNITSNRMYGVFAGCEQEWYLGHGIAVQWRLDGALYLDSVKEKAKYETAAKYLNLPQNKRTKIEWEIAPAINTSLGLMWYPTEFVQLYGGYDFMAFFNTRASPRPIDFDYSNLNPRWTRVNRLIDGWSAGIAFTF